MESKYTSRMIDYQTILLWMAAEHKSQGGLMKEILSEHDRINEQCDNNARLMMIENLFTQLANIH